MKPEEPRGLDVYERELSAEEFDRWVAQSLSDEADMQSLSELIAWFTRRYPTPIERLAYVRRKMKEHRAFQLRVRPDV